MFRLIQKVVERERTLGTYKPRRRDLMRQAFGSAIDGADQVNQ